jgi:hypothetical protein
MEQLSFLTSKIGISQFLERRKPMSKQWCGGMLVSIVFAGALLAQQDRDLHVVSSKNNDGSVYGALAGEMINLGDLSCLINRH